MIELKLYDCYGHPFYFIGGVQYKKFIKHVNKKHGLKEDSSRDICGECFSIEDKGRHHEYIFIESVDWTCGFYAILAHECLHLTINRLDRFHFLLNVDNQEPHCYYFQRLYQNLLEELNEIRKNKTIS